MNVNRQLDRISRLEKKITEYREALETVRRLERDPELRRVVEDEDQQQVDPVEKKKEEEPTTKETKKEEKKEKEASSSEKKTDQETLIALAATIEGEFSPDTLLEVAKETSDEFTDDGSRLDSKKINDHLSRAVRDAKVFDGKRVERVKEGKRGRGGYPATYRVIAVGGEGGETPRN